MYNPVPVNYLGICLSCLDKPYDLLAPCLIIHSICDVVDAEEVIAAVHKMNRTV